MHKVEFWFERTELGHYTCSEVHKQETNGFPEWQQVAQTVDHTEDRFWHHVAMKLAAGKVVKLKPFHNNDLIVQVKRVGSEWSY